MPEFTTEYHEVGRDVTTEYNLPSSESSVQVVDGLGSEHYRLVPVDTLKSRFFALGLQCGVALQMFVISMVLMFVASLPSDASAKGASSVDHEISGMYYPVFRGLFLISFFGSCYGLLLFVWKRSGVDYAAILGVNPGKHNYHSIIRASFMLMTIVFSAFVVFVLTLTSRLTPNKHVWPAAAVLGSIAYLGWPADWMPEWSDRQQRAALGRTLLRVLASPFSAASFEHSFVADVLTSRVGGHSHTRGSARSSDWVRRAPSQACPRSSPTCSSAAASTRRARPTATSGTGCTATLRTGRR
jgi:hypothetical protein